MKKFELKEKVVTSRQVVADKYYKNHKKSNTGGGIMTTVVAGD